MAFALLVKPNGRISIRFRDAISECTAAATFVGLTRVHTGGSASRRQTGAAASPLAKSSSQCDDGTSGSQQKQVKQF